MQFKDRSKILLLFHYIDNSYLMLKKKKMVCRKLCFPVKPSDHPQRCHVMTISAIGYRILKSNIAPLFAFFIQLSVLLCVQCAVFFNDYFFWLINASNALTRCLLSSPNIINFFQYIYQLNFIKYNIYVTRLKYLDKQR